MSGFNVTRTVAEVRRTLGDEITFSLGGAWGWVTVPSGKRAPTVGDTVHLSIAWGYEPPAIDAQERP